MKNVQKGLLTQEYTISTAHWDKIKDEATCRDTYNQPDSVFDDVESIEVCTTLAESEAYDFFTFFAKTKKCELYASCYGTMYSEGAVSMQKGQGLILDYVLESC